MDVAVWLRGLGLQQYEALFRENDIDAEVLNDLTDDDLVKIGVSLGHRKRLLKAVAALAGPAAARPAAVAPIPVADGAERRQRPCQTKSGPMHHGMRLARQVGIPSEDQAMTVPHSASAAERLCL